MEVEEESSLASSLWLWDNIIIDAEAETDTDDDIMIPLAPKEEEDDTTLLVVEVRAAAGALTASSDWDLASIISSTWRWSRMVIGYLLEVR